MAAPTSPSADNYFAGRSPITSRTRPPLNPRTGTPGSPHTPLLGRSISSQFGSPGSFRVEQEDFVVYELGATHLGAGFAGESRPRCIVRFGPEMGRRVGDYREFDPAYRKGRRKEAKRKGWGEDYELYRTDIRGLDLSLVEDKLERAVRHVHSDFLQLDQKPRKAVLAVPSLLPTPLLEVALKVLFGHYSQPPSVMILTTPILACVGAGLRNALVVEVGWEETVVTAVGEYKEAFQRRTVRGGKMLTQKMGKVLEEEAKKTGQQDDVQVDFKYAEDVTERMGWCRPRAATPEIDATRRIPLPTSGCESLPVPLTKLSEPVETTLFATNGTCADLDDHDLPIQSLAYRVLLALPLDLRALCISRLVITGGVSQLPGLKPRVLDELNALIEKRGWDPVARYGSASAHHDRVLRERDANALAFRQKPPDPEPALNAERKPIQDAVQASQRVHDDVKHPITLRFERNHGARGGAGQGVQSVVRGVETLGAWAGASLVASLRVKGVHEVEREEFLKHGLRDSGLVY